MCIRDSLHLSRYFDSILRSRHILRSLFPRDSSPLRHLHHSRLSIRTTKSIHTSSSHSANSHCARQRIWSRLSQKHLHRKTIFADTHHWFRISCLHRRIWNDRGVYIARYLHRAHLSRLPSCRRCQRLLRPVLSRGDCRLPRRSRSRQHRHDERLLSHHRSTTITNHLWRNIHRIHHDSAWHPAKHLHEKIHVLKITLPITRFRQIYLFESKKKSIDNHYYHNLKTTGSKRW